MVLVASGELSAQQKKIPFQLQLLTSSGPKVLQFSLTLYRFFFKKEKSLFGFAALLMNNTPGVIFDAWDLVSSAIAFC